MLAEQQVFNRVIIEQTEQIAKIGGVIFGLKAYVDLDVIPVFLPEHFQRHYIIVKLVDMHPESGCISVGKRVGCVV